jgi:protocatechuate 3,4-dioxygenase beta subunit
MTPELRPQPTPSQTVGLFFHDALLDEDRSGLVSPDHPEALRIEGTVYDGAGEPVTDAMVEIWQANQAGRYNDPVLSSIEDLDLRRTLVAHCEGEALRFDIYLQSENQTAYFEL